MPVAACVDTTPPTNPLPEITERLFDLESLLCRVASLALAMRMMSDSPALEYGEKAVDAVATTVIEGLEER